MYTRLQYISMAGNISELVTRFSGLLLVVVPHWHVSLCQFLLYVLCHCKKKQLIYLSM